MWAFSLRLRKGPLLSGDRSPIEKQSLTGGSTMPSTANYRCGELQDLIDRLIAQGDPGLPPSFTQALLSFLTAMEYDDLIHSAMEEALAELQQVVFEAIQKRLERAKEVRDACQEAFKLMKEAPGEDWDEAGKLLGTLFDKPLKTLTDILEGPVKLLR